MSQKIWEANELQQQLWEDDESRAARLAYLQVLMHWGQQVEEGQYTGVPAMHGLSRDAEGEENHTMRSRPPRYTPDASAGAWSVPNELRQRWLKAA